MSVVYKCDCCDKVNNGSNTALITIQDAVTSQECGYKELHLCHKCSNDLYLWLNNKAAIIPIHKV